MKTMKTLTLAGVTALSLGAGSAMAQESPSGGFPDYWGQRNLQAINAQAQAPKASRTGGLLHTFRFQAHPAQDDPNQMQSLMGGGG